MDDQAESRTRARRHPAEHLVVAVGVAEGRDRSAADGLLDAYGFAGLVVDEVNLSEAEERGLAVAEFVLQLDGAADNLLGRDTVGRVRPGAA